MKVGDVKRFREQQNPHHFSYIPQKESLPFSFESQHPDEEEYWRFQSTNHDPRHPHEREFHWISFSERPFLQMEVSAVHFPKCYFPTANSPTHWHTLTQPHGTLAFFVQWPPSTYPRLLAEDDSMGSSWIL